MSDTLGRLDKVAASNLFARKAKQAWAACACCLRAMGESNCVVFGLPGCQVLNTKDIEVAAVYAAYRVKTTGGKTVQTFKCLRCMFVGRECFAVPAEMDVPWDVIHPLITAVDTALKATPFKEDDVDLAVMKLSKATKGYIKQLDDYNPHAEHLYLTSGAYREGDDPSSGVKKEGTSRSKAKQEVKKVVKKRMMDDEIESELKKAKLNPRGSRKSIVAVNQILREMRECVEKHTVELRNLRDEAKALSGKAKAAKNKEIKAREKALGEAERELQEYLSSKGLSADA